MIRFLLAALLAFAVTSTGVARATIIESGDLNIISDIGNPSDGLRFLDMTFSDGLTLADALTNAQATYANARLATPDEWDDLFAAAGITYSGALTASDAFATGSSVIITPTQTQPAITTLITQLGATVSTDLFIWSDPDGDNDAVTTRDFLVLTGLNVQVSQTSLTAPNSSLGWLIVSEPTIVPEPSTAPLMALGLFALGVARRIF